MVLSTASKGRAWARPLDPAPPPDTWRQPPSGPLGEARWFCHPPDLRAAAPGHPRPGPARPQPARPQTTGLQAAVPRGPAPPPHWLLPRQRLRGGQSPRGPLGRRWAGPTPGGAGPAPGGAGPRVSRAPFNLRARLVAVASLRPIPSRRIPSPPLLSSPVCAAAAGPGQRPAHLGEVLAVAGAGGQRGRGGCIPLAGRCIIRDGWGRRGGAAVRHGGECLGNAPLGPQGRMERCGLGG